MLQRRTLGTVAAAAGGVGAATTTTAFAFDFTAPPVLCEDEPLSEYALSMQRQKAKNAEMVAAAISGDAAAISSNQVVRVPAPPTPPTAARGSASARRNGDS